MKPKGRAQLTKEKEDGDYDVEAASYVKKRSDSQTRKCLRECVLGFFVGLCGCSVLIGVVMFSVWIAI